MAKSQKKLELSVNDKKLAGVCGGMAQYFEVDSTIVRVLWVLGTIITGVFPGLFAYLVCAIIIPKPSA